MLNVLLYEENSSLREALCSLLNGMPNIHIKGCHGEINTIKEDVRFHKPDIVLLDNNLLSNDGYEALQVLTLTDSPPKVLLLTTFEEDERVFAAMCHGARGQILKRMDMASMVGILSYIYEGGIIINSFVAAQILKLPLSRFVNKENIQESKQVINVLTFLSKGYSYKMIANKLNITIEYVEHTLKTCYEKLQTQTCPPNTKRINRRAQ